MIAAAITVMAFLGLLLLWLGVRGRRLDDHPVCRKCKYDLSGLDAPTNCPECGSELTKKRRVRIGQRRKRPIVLALGVALLSISLVIGGFELRGFDWTPHKPVWLLLLETEHRDATHSDIAGQELVRRVNLGLLSDEQVERIVEKALRIQSDRSIEWRPVWGDIVEAAWTGGHLTDEDAGAYVQTGFDAAITVETRGRVREGLPLQVRLIVEAERLGSTGRGRPYRWLHVQCTQLVMGDRILAEFEPGRQPTVYLRSHSQPRDSGSARLPGEEATAAADVSLPVGKHMIVFAMEVRSVFQLRSRFPTLNWKLNIPVEVEVVERGRSIVTLVADPLLLDAVRHSIDVEIVHSRHRGYDVLDGGLVYFDHPPVNLSFDVFARHDGVEHEIGSVAAVAGMRSVQYLDTDPADLFPDARFVDVIFRASPEAAEQTIDIDEIWDGEIVIENVPVVFELDLRPRE